VTLELATMLCELVSLTLPGRALDSLVYCVDA
jgi:hypothetical protein